MTAPAPVQGPCTDWITGADVAAVCDLLNYASDPSVYDNAAHMASQLLWAASGRQFGGTCGPRTVRPCVRSCQCWPVALGFNGWAWGWDSIGWSWGAYWLGGGGDGVSAVQDCGGGGGCCGSLSRVKLAGYPVREIEEVKIDGAVIDPANYRLDDWKYLTYLNDADGNPQRWPSCQNLARDDTEPGTFSVTYLFGVDPPAIGLDAAAELACALVAVGGDCELPPGTTGIDRQGIRIEMVSALASRHGQLPPGLAALPLVQAFLQTYNPQGLAKRSSFYSPDNMPYAQKIG